MQLGLIADIHGNLLALDAVLAAIARRGIARVVCLGDLALNGPRPRECVARVMALDCPTLLGNNDAWLLEDAKPLGVAGQWMQELEAWNSRQLTPVQRDWVRALPATLTIDLGHARTLCCCHGSPFERALLPGRFKTFPWAEYAVISASANQIAVELCRLPLAEAAIAADTRASGMPHAECWIAERKRYGS